jgi:hypothetical protein
LYLNDNVFYFKVACPELKHLMKQRQYDSLQISFLRTSLQNKLIFANVIIRIPAISTSKSLCNFSVENSLTTMTVAGQRLARQVPERYAVNKNKRPLQDNGFGICIAARTCSPLTTLR